MFSKSSAAEVLYVGKGLPFHAFRHFLVQFPFATIFSQCFKVFCCRFAVCGKGLIKEIPRCNAHVHCSCGTATRREGIHLLYTRFKFVIRVMILLATRAVNPGFEFEHQPGQHSFYVKNTLPVI